MSNKDGLIYLAAGESAVYAFYGGNLSDTILPWWFVITCVITLGWGFGRLFTGLYNDALTNNLVNSSYSRFALLWVMIITIFLIMLGLWKILLMFSKLLA